MGVGLLATSVRVNEPENSSLMRERAKAPITTKPAPILVPNSTNASQSGSTETMLWAVALIPEARKLAAACIAISMAFAPSSPTVAMWTSRDCARPLIAKLAKARWATRPPSYATKTLGPRGPVLLVPNGATQDLLARGAYIARGFKLKICLASDQSQVVAFDFSKEAFRRTPHDFEHFHRNASRPAMAFKCGQPTSSAGARIDKLRLVPNVLEARTADAGGPASMNAGLVDDGHANEVGLLLARDLDRGQGRRFAARRTIDIDQDTLDHSSPPKHWACHWIGALFPEIRSPFLQLAWSSIQSHCNHPLKRR